MKMKRKREYTKPVIVLMAIDSQPVLAAESVRIQQDHETEEACSKNNVFGTVWEDDDQDNE